MTGNTSYLSSLQSRSGTQRESGPCATIGIDAFPEDRKGRILQAERDGGGSGACQIGFGLSRMHGIFVVHAPLAITPAEVSLLIPPDISVI